MISRPKAQATLCYRLLALTLQSRIGVLFTLLGALALTTVFFQSINKKLEHGTSWQTRSWKKRAGQLGKKEKCAALKMANRKLTKCNNKNKENVNAQVREQTNLSIHKSADESLANKLNKELKQRKETLLDPDAIYIELHGQNKQKEFITTKEEPYREAKALLEISRQENATKRALQARLWIVTDDNVPRFSKTILGHLFRQEKWKIGLWPTQTLLEPSEVGRWLTHNFKQVLKQDFDAGYLLPNARKIKRAEFFLNNWMQITFGSEKQTLIDESFWLTFINGTNEWGLIQWFSTFFAIFTLLQLLLRFLMTELESIILLAYRKTHPIPFYQNEDPSTLYNLRSEFTNERGQFPRLQKFFLLRVMDYEFQSNDEFLSEKIEISRKIIDFLITSLSSIGFIGTITGIAFAINKAHQVVTPDEFARLQAIKSLSTDLALAFSTTFVALVLTLLCDFFAKQQWKKEDLLVEEIKVIHQAWLWQKKNTPFEQAQCTLPPRD